MGKPEGQIEDYLGKLCKEYDFIYFKFTSPMNSGVPDRCLIGHGKTVFVELKRPGGKPRKLQRAVFKNMEEHGAPVYVVDTKESARKLMTKLAPNYVPKLKSKSTKLNVKSMPFKVMSVK